MTLPTSSFWSSGLQDSDHKFCCFKPPTLWYFITAGLGREYSSQTQAMLPNPSSLRPFLPFHWLHILPSPQTWLSSILILLLPLKNLLEHPMGQGPGQGHVYVSQAWHTGWCRKCFFNDKMTILRVAITTAPVPIFRKYCVAVRHRQDI